MTVAGTKDLNSLFFLFNGKIYRIPENRVQARAHTPVKMSWSEFEATVVGWRNTPFSVDSFLGASNMKGRGYSQRNILPIETSSGWVWASSIEVTLSCEERTNLGLGQNVDSIGNNIVLAWPASKACHAWESAAEASRLDSVYRVLVDCEPTRRILSPSPLNLETVPDAVEVALESLSNATRMFLSCVTFCQTLAFPRFEGDDYVDRVHAHVAKKQAMADFRRAKEQPALARVLEGLPRRGVDGRIDWTSPALDKMLSADELNGRRRMSAVLWTGAMLARTAMTRKRPREYEEEDLTPRTPERGSSAESTVSSPRTLPASPPEHGAEMPPLQLLPVRKLGL